LVRAKRFSREELSKVYAIMMMLSRLRCLLLIVLASGFLSSIVSAQRPPRPAPTTGPFSLPILAALPTREDTSFYQVRDVPHGTIEQTTYKDLNGVEKRMHVYLPPDYATSTATYPVLYLNHGGGDDDSRWSATEENAGHAHVILDNLLAEQNAKPMIVVMPNTRGIASYQPPSAGEQDPCAKEYLECIIPHIEKTYRARPDRDSRAIAGLSMGGFVVLNTGIPNLDTFSELYVYSSGYIQDEAREAMKSSFASVLSDKEANKRFNVPLYFAAGETDIALNNSFKTMANFNAAGVRTFSVLSDGGHDWNNWRRYLWQTAQIMFPGSVEKATETSVSNPLAGCWTATIDTQIGEQEYTYVFVEEDNQLSGTATMKLNGEEHQSKLVDVKLGGNAIEFKEQLTFQQFELEINYSGQLNANEMKLTRQVGEIATEELVASRVE
jgi:enterochelin esterase-like enzyme